MTPRGSPFEVFAIASADRVFRLWLNLQDTLPSELFEITFSIVLERSAYDKSALAALTSAGVVPGIQEPLPFVELLRRKKVHGDLIESITYALLNHEAVVHLGHVPEHLLKFVREAVHRAHYGGFGLLPLAGGVFAVRARTPEIGHTAPVEAAIFHPDSRRLLTLASDLRPRVWDAARGRQLYVLREGAGERRAEFFDGGRSLLTWSFDGLALWDARTGRLHREIGIPEGIESVTSNDEVRTIGVSTGWGSKSSFMLLDQRGKILSAVKFPNSVISASRGFRYLAVGDDDRRLEIFDVKGREVARLAGSFVTFGPGRNEVMTWAKNELHLWRLPEGTLVRTQPGSFEVDWSPRGDAYLTSGRSGRTLMVSATGRPRLSIPEDVAKWSHDGRFVVATNSELGMSSVYRVRDGRVLFTAGVDELSISPDSTRAAGSRRRRYTDADEQNTLVFDLRTGNQLEEIEGSFAAFSPDSLRLVVVSNGVPRIYDARTLRGKYSLGGIEFLDVQERGGGGGGGGRPAEKTEKRYAEIEYPDTVLAERTFTLSVGLIRKEPEIASEFSGPVLPRPLMLTPGTCVTVVLAPSPDFELLSSSKFDLEVFPRKDTEPQRFELRAKTDVRGPRELKLIFFQGFEILAQRKIVVKVAASMRSAAAPRHATLWMRETDLHTGNVARPDVILYVDRETHRGRDTLIYSCEWAQKDWPRTDAGRVEFQVSAQAWLEPRYQQLSVWARKDGKTRELEKLGENLYFELFSPELREIFVQFAAEAHTILIYTNEPWIPWELVKPWGKGVPERARDFLAASFQLSRWYYSESGQRPRGFVPLRSALPVIPPSDLKAVYRESQYFHDLPSLWPGVEVRRPWPDDPSKVVDDMRGGWSQLIHFAAHGSLSSRQPGPALRVGGGYLSSEDLVGDALADGVDRAGPFIFVNACHSTRQTSGLTRNEGWVERLLELGASGFLGANWEVDDGLAADFAIGVYDRLRSGLSAGVAVHASRMDLRGARPGNSSWLAYSLWSHPEMRVRAAAASQPSEGAHV